MRLGLETCWAGLRDELALTRRPPSEVSSEMLVLKAWCQECPRSVRQECPTGSRRSVLQECATRAVYRSCPQQFSNKSVPQKCSTRVSCKRVRQQSVPEECPPNKSVLQECPTTMSDKHVRQECPMMVSHKSVLQECPTRVSYKVLQERYFGASVAQDCQAKLKHAQTCPLRVFLNSVEQECQTTFGC